jgi:anti-sigma regulatory factor (Ser/Thr protein kinase)
VLPGLAELMINAVEHGNLEIGYERKSQLLESGTWKEEIARRLEDEKYWERSAEAVLSRKEDGIYFVVTDQGEGFNWQRYMMIDPSRAGDNHGRGIAQANAVSFDKLAYNAKGNQVVAFVSSHQQLEW